MHISPDRDRSGRRNTNGQGAARCRAFRGAVSMLIVLPGAIVTCAQTGSWRIASLAQPTTRFCMNAARPVLAHWFDQPGRQCPFEARAAVSMPAPLRHLPVRWRALTLVVLRDLFGADLATATSTQEVARHLFRRAVPLPSRRQGRVSAIGKEKAPVAAATGRVQRLSKNPVHRLNGNFLDERADFSRIHP